MTDMNDQSINLLTHTKYGDGYIGAGLTKNPKTKEDVVGFRIVKDGKLIYWLNLTLSEALDISSHLTIAVNSYLMKNKKYIPNP